MGSQEKSCVRPLPKRVLDIRNDECALPMNLYVQKYISADNETSLAKDLLIHNMLEPVTVMITRAVFYTYMGFRSIISFVAFFRSLYCNLSTAVGRAALKTWFLQAIQQREYLHYNHYPIDKEKQDSLIALINGILNDRLIDKADCVTYLSGSTLETLNIIPCKTRFDRRCERLKLAPMYMQNKNAISTTYNSPLVNKVIHHYILKTMDLDNTKYGYAIIPHTDIDEYDKLFRGYLTGDEKLDANIIIDIMLDLFLDEIQHNYLFWMEIIKRSMDMDMTRISNAADDGSSCSSTLTVVVDNETPIVINKSILADLFALKLHDPTTPDTTIPCAIHYALALLIKADLLDLDTLLSHHQQQDNGWVTPLVMAMFTIGDHTRALLALQKTNLAVSGSLCDWLQQMMVNCITSWLADQTATKSIKISATTAKIATPKSSKRKRRQKKRPSPLAQVTLPQDINYAESNTDDEDITNDDYDDQHADHWMISPARTEDSFDSTTTAVNTLLEDNILYQDDDECDDNNMKGFDYFSTQFFYQQTSTSPTALQLLMDFVVPCMISIGGAQMAASPNTMNKIIILLQKALRHYRQPEDRPYLAQLFASYIFPVLSFTLLDNLHECLQLLTTDERLGVYLRWRDDRSDDTLRAYRDQAIEDVENVVDSISSHSSPLSQDSNHNRNDNDDNDVLNSFARHHPIDVAGVILDRIEKINTDDDNNGTSIMMVATNLVSGDQALVRDALIALLAHRLLTFDINKHTTGNPSSLPTPVMSLCRFSRYLIDEGQLSSTALLTYLTGSSSMRPEFLTSRFIDYACGLNPNTIHKPLTKKRTSSVLGTSSLTNKRSHH